MMTYARTIEKPKTKRDGLVNFVQIIINYLELGDTREAILAAVNLREDVECGRYNSAMTDAKGYSALPEAQAKHAAEISGATQSGFERGVASERSRIVKLLGLTT